MVIDGKKYYGIVLYKARRALKEDFDNLSRWGDEWKAAKPYYAVRLCLLGTARHIGVAASLRDAQLLYDSALFHLWGFIKRPLPRFHILQPGSPPPPMFPEVAKAKTKLAKTCAELRLDFSSFDRNFLQRNDP